MVRRESDVCWKRLCCFGCTFLGVTVLALGAAYLVGWYALHNVMVQLQGNFWPANLNASLASLGKDSPEFSQDLEKLQAVLQDGTAKDGAHDPLLLMQGIMRSMMENFGTNSSPKNLKEETMREKKPESVASGKEEAIKNKVESLKKLKDVLLSLRLSPPLRRQR